MSFFKDVRKQRVYLSRYKIEVGVILTLLPLYSREMIHSTR